MSLLRRVREQVLGGIAPASLNFVNMLVSFSISNEITTNQLFANNNYRSKETPVDVSPFGKFGNGNFYSSRDNVTAGLTWAQNPWDVRVELGSGKPSIRESVDDPIRPGSHVLCHSSTDLSCFQESTFDLVITDPPFGDNIFYSDLANFFHAWLRLPLRQSTPTFSTGTG